MPRIFGGCGGRQGGRWFKASRPRCGCNEHASSCFGKLLGLAATEPNLWRVCYSEGPAELETRPLPQTLIPSVGLVKERGWVGKMLRRSCSQGLGTHINPPRGFLHHLRAL